VAAEREVLVSIGGADSRTVILIPEVKGSNTTGITLVHVKLHELISPANARAMLQGYDRRYDRLVDWVSETEGGFNEDRLAEISVVEMLTSPISEVAKHWRAQ
jgi:glucosamine--fructose-6-phosphate aminotransferase (isomerizing)